MRDLLLCPLVLAFLSLVGPTCLANPVGFTAISYPGASATAPESVNSSGVIVGSYDDQAGNTHGFSLAGSLFTTLDYPGASATFAKGINNLDDIVGDTVVSGNDLGFLDSGNTFSSVVYPGAESTDAAAINDAGKIAGTYVNSSGAASGFLYSGGVFTPINVPGADDTFLGGINDAGQVVGSFDISGANFGFLYSGGAFTTIAYPDAIDTFANGINNLGQITGFSFNSDGTADGFLDIGGNFTLEDYPGAEDTYLKGGNDVGTYVGFYDNGGSSTGFSVVTTPEPGSLSLILIATPGLFWLVRRKSRFSRHAAQALVLVAALLTQGREVRAQTSTLFWVYPLDGQILGGNNVLLYTASSDPNATGQVDFEYSTDNVTFVPMPQQDAGSNGPSAFTSSFDATAFPTGTLYFRARFDTDTTGPVLRVQIAREPSPVCTVTRLSLLDASFDCSASSDTNGGIASYAFDFGDGSNTVSAAPKATHTYASFGLYPVAVTLTDAVGLSSTLYKQLYLVQLALLENRPACGCAKMTLNAKTGATYTLTDPRRPDGKGGWSLAVMGPDPMYLSYNFEVSTALTKDSDATKCTEGQKMKGTYSLPAPGEDKSACSAGRTTISPCKTNEQCSTYKCMGGVSGIATCNTNTDANKCLIGGGKCVSNSDGTCTKYPFTGNTRGYDDYQSPYPDPGTIKLHIAPTGMPVWNDFPGQSNTMQAKIGADYRMDTDFLAFVNGPGGNCSCHFTVVLDWDDTKKVYRPATGITLVKDAETANCEINQ